MKVFVTGAGGYIGGSLVERLRDSGAIVVGLVRSEEKANALRYRGIHAIVGDLTDTPGVLRGADGADVIVNTAEADDVDLIRPLLAGIEGTGKRFIHTGGSSIVVDDAQGESASGLVYDDDAPFSPQPHREPRVNVDRLVRAAGIRHGLRTVVISPTMVYGRGRGLKSDSHQIPLLAAKSRSLRAGVFIGRGRPIWSAVHIDDLLDLYLLTIERAPSGSFFFAEAEETSFGQIAVALSYALGFGGRTVSWPLAQAVAEIGEVARIALATNCRVRATHARRLLNWRPSRPKLAESLT